MFGANLVLASRSPQRVAILKQLGVAFTVRPTDVEETSVGAPAAVALANARAKAAALPAAEGETVLGVDTLVALGQEIFGKPADGSAAAITLDHLQGAVHTVVSGLVIRCGDDVREAVAVTHVTFRPLTAEQIAAYVAVGEWQGRAGGYAIQERGAALVRVIDGDYLNVVGLPVATLLDIAPELNRTGPLTAR